MNLQEMIENNGFTFYRHFSAYDFIFNKNSWLKPRLLSITQNFHWIDGGSGIALPQLQALNLIFPDRRRGLLPLRQRRLLRATAITYSRPKRNAVSARINRILDNPPPSFQYLIGDFSSLSEEQIGRADLITDYYGIVSYTQDLTNVLERYLRLLNVNGELLFLLSKKIRVEYNGRMQPLTYVICDILPPEYFSCESERISSTLFGISFRIRKIKEPGFNVIPQWKFDEKRFKTGAPPTNYFVIPK